MNIKRGEIYLATLDPVVGKEISKTRLIVIVSNDKNNEFSGTVTILPVSSKNLQKIYPFEVFLSKGAGNLPKNSKVKADQIRTFDKSRIVTLIGKLRKGEMGQIGCEIFGVHRVNDADADDVCCGPRIKRRVISVGAVSNSCDDYQAVVFRQRFNAPCPPVFKFVADAGGYYICVRR